MPKNKAALVHLISVIAFIQTASARGQKPGEMNVYDEETNTVEGNARVDRPPDTIAPVFSGNFDDTDIATHNREWAGATTQGSHMSEEDRDAGDTDAFYHPSGSARESSSFPTWNEIKDLFAEWVIVIGVVLSILLLAYFVRKWWKKR